MYHRHIILFVDIKRPQSKNKDFNYICSFKHITSTFVKTAIYLHKDWLWDHSSLTCKELLLQMLQILDTNSKNSQNKKVKHKLRSDAPTNFRIGLGNTEKDSRIYVYKVSELGGYIFTDQWIQIICCTRSSVETPQSLNLSKRWWMKCWIIMELHTLIYIYQFHKTHTDKNFTMCACMYHCMHMLG